jgi:hypothetical protein
VGHCHFKRWGISVINLNKGDKEEFIHSFIPEEVTDSVDVASTNGHF